MIGRWFNEGAEAYEKGVLAKDCPYPMDSEQQGQWLAGWTQAYGRTVSSQPRVIAEPHDEDE
ncbi:MAG: hypothetical protein EOO81_01255 [Oxalobacteraceae bacterium]|nr:MAG: hypothetical protein EOO81_01255 [Oxalobacteraceae bacterium]